MTRSAISFSSAGAVGLPSDLHRLAGFQMSPKSLEGSIHAGELFLLGFGLPVNLVVADLGLDLGLRKPSIPSLRP